ncbi:unnamed protein product [Orchesella dallaii]|uniref:Uncharacterized protein n=1 Tax=Orchesella dallaii TaxID=48710 RepID=A0ABP1PTG4_9HEXA
MNRGGELIRRCVLRTFEALKSYHGGKNPREMVFPCAIIRNSIQSLLTCENLTVGTLTWIYQLNYSEEEYNMMTTYPTVWTTPAISGISLSSLDSVLFPTNHARNEVETDSGTDDKLGFEQHKKKFHGAYTKKLLCSVKDCKNFNGFPDVSSFNRHLSNVHNIIPVKKRRKEPHQTFSANIAFYLWQASLPWIDILNAD